MDKYIIDYENTDMKLVASSLIFEMTRRCNLSCKHCMRGEPQNIDISKEIIDKTLDNFIGIEVIHLTGGEPFLNPDGIEYLIDEIIRRKIKIRSFLSVTNGMVLDERGIRCVKAFNKIAKYIKSDPDYKDSQKKIAGISISNSRFHNNDIQKAIDFYKEYADSELVKIEDQGEWIENINGVKIKHKDIKGGVLRSVGRAKENNIPGKPVVMPTYTVDEITLETFMLVKSELQICSNGNISFCDCLSFDLMDNLTMGNVIEKPLSKIILNWNDRTILNYNEVAAYTNELTKAQKGRDKIPEEKQDDIWNIVSYLTAKKYIFREVRATMKMLTFEERKTLEVCMLILRLCEDDTPEELEKYIESAQKEFDITFEFLTDDHLGEIKNIIRILDIENRIRLFKRYGTEKAKKILKEIQDYMQDDKAMERWQKTNVNTI